MSPSKKTSSSRSGKEKVVKVEKGKSARAQSKKKPVKTAQANLKRRRGAEEQAPPVVQPSIPTAEKATNSSSGLGTIVLRILAVLAVVGITVYIYSIRDRVDEFAAYGYPGIFLVMLLANATVILPAPGVAVVFAMGSVFNPMGVALAGGLGGALGELTGYLAGFSGQAVVEKTEIYNRILPWIQKYGAWMILVLSAFPNPFFDMAGIAAGISKIPLWKFLLACLVGQTIKMAMFAYAGYYSIDWITNFYD
ncbi:MAG: VTT domain-containing protein [Anaerolineales bacterium]|nr:VTT domain-containing protein [Anaerolineales bacterium]